MQAYNDTHKCNKHDDASMCVHQPLTICTMRWHAGVLAFSGSPGSNWLYFVCFD